MRAYKNIKYIYKIQRVLWKFPSVGKGSHPSNSTRFFVSKEMRAMNEKLCTKCEEIKPVSEFHKDTKSKDGYKHHCIICRKIKHNKYRDENKEHIKLVRKNNYSKNRYKNLERNKKYHQENKDKIRDQRKTYRENNKDKFNRRDKLYYENNKDKIKEYRENNKEKKSEYNKMYSKKHRDKINSRRKYKIENDPFYKIVWLIRSRTKSAIKRNNLSKDCSTMKMLGCDKNTLMTHLQATGELYDPLFNIYNYDSSIYHIDHKKTFADVQKGIYTLEEVCHYTNLQILPVDINLSKGANSW